MLNYQVRIGLAPLRRDVTPRPGIFNWQKAEERAKRLTAYIKEQYADNNVSFADVAGINDRDIIITERDADLAAERFRDVDAVFIINCNFGNEEAAARLAGKLGKPVLLWAPLDEEFSPDGMRYTDSQCGMFGISRQLQRCNIPFSYLQTCRVEDPLFDQGFRRFVAVACMVKNFRGLRVAQVGMRPKPFCSVIFNEGELLQKFGIQTVPVNLAVVIDKYNEILTRRGAELEKGAALLRGRYELDELTEPLLKKVYAFVLLYQEIFREYDVGAISAECWTAMQRAVGAMPCTAYSILADKGYIVSCESDMHGAISMVLLACASLGKVPFFGEFTVRHPEEKNTELLWHCGPFAYSLKAQDSKASMVNMRQWFRVKDGRYTVARFEQDNGKYTLLSGVCDSAEGPYTFGTYLWAKFKNLPQWEKKLVEGPYIHHLAEIEGDYTEELREFCKYVPHLAPDSVDE